ncbi:MAG: Ig-like domain-containing protein, partial [Thermoanaerobaculia bacterium]
MKRSFVRALLVLASAVALLVPGLASAQDPFAITPTLHKQAVFACGDLGFNGNAGTVDSFGATTSTAPSNQGHIVTNGNITLNGSVVITGNATAGPGKIISLNGNSTISGTRSYATTNANCVPIDLAGLGNQVRTANDNARIPHTAKGNDPLSGASRTDFSMNGNDTITLPAGTYFFTSFSIGGNSTINTAGVVKILCTGSASIYGGADVNTVGNPSNMRIWISGTAFGLKGSSTLKGFVYAPNGAVDVDGGSRVTGAIFAKSVTLSGNSRITRAIDDAPPSISITSPLAGEHVTNISAVLVKGAALDNETIVTVTVNGTSVPVGTDGSFSTTVNLSGVTPPEIVAVATDGGGQTATKRVTVCLPAPVATLLSPVSPTKTRLATLSGNCGAATGVTIAMGTGTAVPATVTTGTGTFTLSGFDLGADGDHALFITASNSCGSTTSTALISLDTVPPVISIDSPRPGAFLGSSPIPVSGTAVDAHPGSVTVNGVPAIVSGNQFNAAAVSIPEGSSSIVVVAKDALAQSSSASVSVTLDSAAPTVTINTPQSGEVVSAPFITVTGTADDPNLDSVKVNGKPGIITGTTFRVENLSLIEGANSLIATAIDKAGHPGLSQPTSVSLDTLPPAVAIDGASLAAVTKSDKVTVTGTASDPHLKSVTVNGMLAVINLANGTFTAVDVPLPLEGNNQLVARATDIVGHAANSDPPVTISRDTQAPIVAITSPAVNDKVANATLMVRGTVSDAHLGDVRVGNTVAQVLPNGTWIADNVPVAEGEVPLVATATDAVSNVGTSASVLISVDSISPVIRIDAPANALFGAAVATVTGTVTDVHLQSVTVSGVPATAIGGIFSAENVPLTEGRQELRAIALDSFGHQTISDPVIFERDTVPPSISIDAPSATCLPVGLATTISGTYGDLHAAGASQVAVHVNVASTNGTTTGFDATLDAAGRGWSVPNVDLGSIDGFASITAIATDAVGQTARAARSVRMDATVPIVQILLDGGIFPGSGAGPVVPAGEQPALFNRTILPRTLVADGASSAPPPASLTLDGAPFQEGTPIATEGTHTLVAHAVDCAAHDGAAHASFTLDLTAPKLTSTTPVEGAKLGSAVTSLSGTSDADLLSASVNGNAASVTAQSGVFTLTPFPWKEGLNTVSIELVDRAGNRAAFTRTFTVKTLAPAIEILESGVPIRSGSVFFRAVTATVRSNDDEVTVDSTLNGAPYVSGSTIPGPGDQTLVATASDSFGHSSPTSTIRFKIDLSSAPTVAITTPADQAVVPSAVTVTGTASASAVSVSVNGRTVIPAAGAWTVADLALEPDVPNEIVAVARDAEGRTASDSRSVIVRGSGPTILILSPSDGTRTNRKKIDVSGAVVGGSSFTADGTVVVGGVSIRLDATGAFRAKDVPLFEGANTITASATDKQGRTSPASVTVVADLTSPIVLILADDQPLADNASFSRSFVLRVEATDGANAAPVPLVRLDGQDRGATSGVLSFTVSEPGGHIVSVIVRDTAGNETRSERSFVLDQGGCSLSELEPANGSAVHDAKVTIHGHSGTATAITIRVPNAGTNPVTFQDFTAQLADGTFAAGDVPLPILGDNALEVVCLDAVGQTTTTPLQLRRISADAGPLVQVTSPVNGSRTKLPTIALLGTVSDATASVFVNGSPATVIASTGSFNLNAVQLVEGPNVLGVQARDRYGRIGTARLVVELDSTAPKVQITSPSNNTLIGPAASSAATVDVTGLVEIENEPNLQRVVVSSAVGSVTATLDAVTGAFSAIGVPLSISAGSATPQTITATATDSLGQAGVSGVKVFFDPSGPALRLAQPVDNTSVTETSGSSIPVVGDVWATEGAQLSLNGGGFDPSSLTWAAAGGGDLRKHAHFSLSVPVPSEDGPVTILARVEQLGGKFANDRRLLAKDTSAPTVVEISPAEGSRTVDPNAQLLVLFSETVAKASLRAANGLTLIRISSGNPVVGTMAIAGSAVAFVPGAALERGEIYKFRAGTAITDLAGHPLAAAKEVSFTVALSPTDAAPVLDPIAAVLCGTSLVVSGTAVPGSTVRVRDEELSFSGTTDAAGHFKVTISLSGSGFHHIHAESIGHDGSTSPEASALFRVDCSAPTVVAYGFDRITGRISVTFSEPMTASSLTVGSAASAIRISDAENASRTPQSANVTLSASGLVAVLELESAQSAWWRTKSVRFEVGAPAADVRGNQMLARFETIFFLGGGSGDLAGSFLSGEVYDDESGRPLSGVDALLFASGSSLPGSSSIASAPFGSAVSDARGRFGFAGDIAAGRYALVLSRSGYTRVVRRIPLEPSTGAVPFDSRLTQLAPASGTLSTSSAATIAGSQGSSLVLSTDANAIASGASLAVQLTRLSGQGLPELLPLGYTPLSAANVALANSTTHAEVFADFSATANAKLTVPLPVGIAVGAPLIAVRYDLSAGVWITLPAPQQVGTISAPLEAISIPGPGTFAIVVADTDDAIKPPAIAAGAGVVLVGSSLPTNLPALIGTITLDPPVVAPTSRSTATVVARTSDSTTPWPSGLAVQAYLDEKLILAGGGELFESPFTADLVLYHPPLTVTEQGSATPAAVGAMSFRVSPSPRAAQVVLESGVDNVRLFPFPEQLDRGSVLGPSGGSIVSPDGVEVVLAEGALAQRTIVKARLLTSAEFAQAQVPTGFDLVAAVRVDFAGTVLARPATMKVSIPSGLVLAQTGEAQFVLANWIEQPADSRGAFARVVERAAKDGTPEKIVATPEVANSQLPLEGLIREGTYLVLHAKAPIAFASGLITADNNFGLTGARATAAGLGTADLSAPGGTYALAIPAGTAALTALHPTRGDTGTATLSNVASGSINPINIVIGDIAPTVLGFQPLDKSIDQPVGSPIIVRFSEPLAAESIDSTTLRAELADTATGAATGVTFSGTVTRSQDGTAVVLTPQRPLPPGRKILCTFRGGVRDTGGTSYQGAVPLVWSFSTSTTFVVGGQVHPDKFHLE